jgi:hypothetical protein
MSGIGPPHPPALEPMLPSSSPPTLRSTNAYLPDLHKARSSVHRVELQLCMITITAELKVRNLAINTFSSLVRNFGQHLLLDTMQHLHGSELQQALHPGATE